MYKLLTLFVCVPALYAQTMNVILASGNAVSVSLDDITKITFTTDTMEINAMGGTESVALDSITRATFDTFAVSGINAPDAADAPFVTGVRVHPNPVFSSTSLNIVLRWSGHVKVSVCPQDGSAPVAVLHDGFAAAGARSFTWDGKDTNGRPVPNGSYVIMIDGISGRTAIRTLVIR